MLAADLTYIGALERLQNIKAAASRIFQVNKPSLTPTVNLLQLNCISQQNPTNYPSIHPTFLPGTEPQQFSSDSA
jgi:hypothetical protein